MLFSNKQHAFNICAQNLWIYSDKLLLVKQLHLFDDVRLFKFDVGTFCLKLSGNYSHRALSQLPHALQSIIEGGGNKWGRAGENLKLNSWGVGKTSKVNVYGVGCYRWRWKEGQHMHWMKNCNFWEKTYYIYYIFSNIH